METALINMFMGIGVVFAVLIIISLIITCFRIFPYLENKYKEKNVVQPEHELVEYQSEVRNDQIPPHFELIAVIMAAIANEENCSTQDFVVKSIKRR